MTRKRFFPVLLLLACSGVLAQEDFKKFYFPMFHSELMPFSETLPLEAGYEVELSMDNVYRYSLVLEQMSVSSCSDVNHPKIIVEKGDNFEEKIELCYEALSYTDGRFSSQTFILTDGYNSSRVRKEGTWGPSDTALLVVSRFAYGYGGCDQCSPGTFCCDQTDSCATESQITSNIFEDTVQCITKDLLCDGHPSCGKQCSKDEDTAVCSLEKLYFPFFQEKTILFSQVSEDKGFEIDVTPSLYHFSILLQKMRVSSCNTTSGTPFIRIVTEDTLDESVYDVCYESIDTVDGVLSEKTFIVTTNKPTKIYKFGNWLENDMAELVITRFMEVGSCSECSADTQFCCAEKSSNSFRCIFNNLTCNGYVNCGFQENTDESRVTCGATLSAWNSLTLVPYLIIWVHKFSADS